MPWFLVWHRAREYDADTQGCVYRGGRHQQRYQKTLVVACRYWYELTDGYWGQFVLTQIPHLQAKDLLPQKKCLVCMQHFFGMMEYTQSWTWLREGVVRASGGAVFLTSALPLLLDDSGAVLQLGSFVEGSPVFGTDRAAFDYLMAIAKRDLQYRGMRGDRVNCFEYKQEANFLLYRRVLASKDDHELEMYRQSWDTVNRPKYSHKTWGTTQQEVLDTVAAAVAMDDEETKRKSKRFLYVKGSPGSGKTAVLLEAAIRCAKNGMTVLIVCPTGALVTALKLLLPDFDGVDRIHVDTVHSVLKYRRGRDKGVAFVPPSGFRKYEVVFCDEGSQYDDQEWERLFVTLREQPHLPYCVIVADFQQLQPVSGGKLCKMFCDRMVTVTLDTVYRSSDGEHLLFQNRIRETQPDKKTLREYFDERHWDEYSLQECVAYGLRMAEEKKCVFTWLTATNRGAAEVCEAALAEVGISKKDLEGGYVCDPTSKSTMRILARPGLVLRLTRNLDKQRGFVNGALAVVIESLYGNAVIIAQLVGTGNFVLIHPMEEDGARFLPCCYGYATTIRRAQGASLDLGCLYFDQHRHHAGRGYGYVGVSRFKSRAGCFLYGKLRVTDFLPVGEEKEDEVLERGFESETSDEDERGMEYAFQGAGADWAEGLGEDMVCMNDDFGAVSEMAGVASLYDGDRLQAEAEVLGDDFS